MDLWFNFPDPFYVVIVLMWVVGFIGYGIRKFFERW